MFFEKFTSFAQEKKLFSEGDKILLAVSGGADSMVMMQLFHRLGFSCEVAHCNFQLRGDESDADEAFVREMARKYEFPVFVTRFETQEYADENKVSIQMAARELRYSWFVRLAKAHGISRIALAHNRDDVAETFFINLGRGTGINGLAGMQVKNEMLIRPLLFAPRTEIEQYAQETEISFRTDSSNASDKYTRNFIRHNVLPSLEKIFPHFRDTLSQDIERLAEAQQIYNLSIALLSSELVSVEGDVVTVDILKLSHSVAPKTLLFEIVRKYGFLTSELDDIFNSISAISGKFFLSKTHKLVKDRERFIITPLVEDSTNLKYYIDQADSTFNGPVNLQFTKIEKTESFEVDRNSAIALLDYDTLEFPLQLRKWQMGDYFVPLGMKGMKKLSDFFVDQKLSIIDKENTWLLLSGNQIVWIVGRRIDNRFKVTDQTQNILRIELSK